MDSVRLVSSDGKFFDAKKTAVSKSPTIMKKLQLIKVKSDDNGKPPVVVLDEIDGETLQKVIKYCDHHDVPFDSLGDEAVVNYLNDFDSKFMNVDRTTFFNLNQAAFYLKIKSLMDLTCGTLSKKLKRKNYKEISEMIENWK